MLFHIALPLTRELTSQPRKLSRNHGECCLLAHSLMPKMPCSVIKQYMTTHILTGTFEKEKFKFRNLNLRVRFPILKSLCFATFSKPKIYTACNRNP